ncbi:MAG: hypothetical protein A2381_10045 [Bdellovibrionales bacterium RIFOXYB1_FULL_37_110]|nr:MAG: hypothetical protein A2417_02560 [Bdellovibrionales bacterium RIFOXYC1_FULL_37_79]OFZ61106.1 MAG: hypothetical protein A2381_10045 [Bdellovibrionales bacterium RIFOXYB1_FULL_37_110]OFZ61615.1 MAG: hypothetical protein A2577_10535 [Bdellovibrionales bacterium RIFOXYD1_FULL_36_51]
MKITIMIFLLSVSFTILAKDLICKNVENQKMVLKMSSVNWDEDSVSGKVKISFLFDDIPFSVDEDGGFADSPYIVGGKITLPDNDGSSPMFIKISKNFRRADVKILADGETLDFGKFSCK